MPDWNSQAELKHDSDAFTNLIHPFAGVYLQVLLYELLIGPSRLNLRLGRWEYVLSLDFDFAFITRRKPFRWPMIFYFANRYLLLCALVGLLVALNLTQKIDCQPLYIFNQFAGNASTIANVNLCLRTIVLYGFSKPIIVLLVILILGHWSLILLDTQIKAVWSDEQNSCLIVTVNDNALTATFIYSTCFNLILFLLNVYKLYYCCTGQILLGKSRFVRIVFGDGLIYFFVVFLTNLVAAVFMLVKLNPVMEVICNVPVVTVNTICATRAIRRLSNFFEKDGDGVLNGSGATSGIHFRGVREQTGSGNSSLGGLAATLTNLGGVHVHTETFTRADIAQLRKRDEGDGDSEVDVKGSPV